MIPAALIPLLLAMVASDPNIQVLPDGVDKSKLKPAAVSPPAAIHALTHRTNVQLPGPTMGGGGVMVMGGSFLTNANSPPASPAPAGLPTLHWKNGETINGTIASATASILTWKTPLFEDPLELDWQVLDRIDWPQVPVPSTDPFAFSMRDGSFIYGDIVSVGADSISIHSAHHGDTMLKRSEVLSARRIRHGGLLFSGPTGNVGWQLSVTQQDGSVTKNQLTPDASPSLATGPGGELQMWSWNRGGILDLQLPDLVDVEMRIQSSVRPDFMLSLGTDLNQSLRVETWDDQLVLVVGNQFKGIRKIEDNEREVALRVCWDVKAQKCSVFSLAGGLITEWQVPGSLSSPAPGLVLLNKGLDLSLELLRVRTWDGKPPPKIDQGPSQVELADGRSVGGEIIAGAPGTIAVQPPGQAAATRFPLGNVDALVFSSDLPQNTSHEATLSYADGTIILGQLASIAGGTALVATSFTNTPLMAKMDGLRQLLVNSPTAAALASRESRDTIRIQGVTLHGKLVGEGDHSPHWIPMGGIKSSRPSKTLPSEITRFTPAEMGPVDPALFYLTSGDVLSGNLRSLDRSGAEFESPFVETTKLTADELDAIQFAASNRLNVQGFNDPGWQIVKGDDKTVQRIKDTLKMEPGSVIAYPSLMQSSEIRFKYLATGFSATRLRMFCSGTDSAHSMNLVLGNTGAQFFAGEEITEGQCDNQVQVKVDPGEPVAVRIMIGSNELELFVNDVSVMRLPFEPAKCAGSGLMIEPANLWGNTASPLALSEFSATSVPGRTWLPEISEDIRKQVLTVPRFEKNDPPRHLLLAANGDVLRGEIEAATDSHFGFRSGLEELNVPRDRVKAVIWLKPPVANSAPPADDNSPPNPLDEKITQRMMFGGIGLNSLISYLQRQDSNLKIRVPDNIDTGRKVRIVFGGQTIGEELDKICAMFDLSYRQDPDGTVVLEPAGQMQSDLESKSYWLKSDAIPTTLPAQDFLSAKGIDFPPGSSANWQPISGLLTMVNTAKSQDKLAALLVSQFGDNLGSPTHWLLLTSGARLALAVDKFAPDFVTGRNPAYGACKIPMSQVYIIRNSAPDPTTTIKMLGNWRLVSAPEPVIPGAGGDNSPLLGKDAIPIKLPSLDGGEFDLDALKGQVVVLDFWATWCAPCIKALPDLISAMASFPADRVKFIGVNQGESPDQVKHFLEARGLKFSVAMDADQSVGHKYGADVIPETVIIGPDGKVAWTQTGYDPDGESEASDVVKKLLDPPTPAPAPARSVTQ